MTTKNDMNPDAGNKTSGEKISNWIDSSKAVIYSELSANMECDVVIVGGGIAGVTTAFALAKEGKSVILLEDGWIGSGETGRTTAHIVNALDDRYYDIEHFHGKDGARLAADSHTSAINFIEQVVTSENIDCDFERIDGYLFPHPTDNPESIQKEFEATHRAGLNTSILPSVPGISGENNTCLHFPGQAQFHPLRYIEGVCQAIIRNGGRIFTKTHVNRIDKTGIGTSSGFSVKARFVVVATNSPVNDIVTMHTKQSAYRTYVIGVKVPKNSLLKALWWDTGDQKSEWPTYPYHYVRTARHDDEYDLLICGGEDYKTGQMDQEEKGDRFDILYDWCRHKFPNAGEVLYKWSGQVLEPVDSLAYIGRNPGDDNIFIVTGDSGNGMTHGTIAAMLIPDLINNKVNPWEKLYDPSRVSIKTADTFIIENANVVKQLGDFLTPGDINSAEELGKNQGAVMRKGLSKIAVYKDETDTVHAFSAICPHLKCVVQWNPDEKTFDCPCHGSRFSCYGKLLNGPANMDLAPAELPQQNKANN